MLLAMAMATGTGTGMAATRTLNPSRSGLPAVTATVVTVTAATLTAATAARAPSSGWRSPSRSLSWASKRSSVG